MLKSDISASSFGSLTSFCENGLFNNFNSVSDIFLVMNSIMKKLRNSNNYYKRAKAKAKRKYNVLYTFNTFVVAHLLSSSQYNVNDLFLSGIFGLLAYRLLERI